MWEVAFEKTQSEDASSASLIACWFFNAARIEFFPSDREERRAKMNPIGNIKSNTQARPLKVNEVARFRSTPRTLRPAIMGTS